MSDESLLCEPQTFMNCQRRSGGRAGDVLQVPVERLLVVVDDADLPLGEFGCGRAAAAVAITGSSRSSSTWARASLRGCGSASAGRDGAREITDHVLGRFSSTEAELVEKVLAGGRPG